MNFDYRLLAITYRNRVEYEDGPGSLKNIVSDVSQRVFRFWEDADENFGTRFLNNTYVEDLSLETDSDDGWYQYSYRLERKAKEDSEWKFVGFLDKHRYREEEEDISENLENEWPEYKEPEYHCLDCKCLMETDCLFCEHCEAKETAWEEEVRRLELLEQEYSQVADAPWWKRLYRYFFR
jgi:hypothetical protein